jgi:hypothetical protein
MSRRIRPLAETGPPSLGLAIADRIIVVILHAR